MQSIKHHDGEEPWSIDADDEPYARQRSNTVKLSKESEVMKNLEKENIDIHAVIIFKSALRNV